MTEQNRQSGQEAQGESESDLKEREYKDEHGNVHHHTKKYLEEHPEDKGRPPRSKSDDTREDC